MIKLSDVTPFTAHRIREAVALAKLESLATRKPVSAYVLDKPQAFGIGIAVDGRRISAFCQQADECSDVVRDVCFAGFVAVRKVDAARAARQLAIALRVRMLKCGAQ